MKAYAICKNKNGMAANKADSLHQQLTVSSVKILVIWYTNLSPNNQNGGNFGAIHFTNLMGALYLQPLKPKCTTMAD